MTQASLTALGPLDGRYADKVAELAPVFSEFGLVRRRVLVEAAWLLALCREPRVREARRLSAAERARVLRIARDFGAGDAARVKAFERRTNHDVKAVEYFLRERLAAARLGRLAPFVHFACTSEDINNLAHALQLREGLEILRREQRAIEDALARMARELRAVPMLAHTHGQAASPTTVGKELAVFVARLREASDALERCPIHGKINGAVGNYNAHVAAYPDVDWPALARSVVEGDLGLTFRLLTTQIEPHDGVAAACDALARWNRVLLDFDRDMWAYISLGYFAQKPVAGEVGSSTMPHKVNPIDFENSEGNLGVANALLAHFAEKLPVSRLQRDLSDSTVLRNLGVAFGHCLLACKSTLRGLRKVHVNRARLAEDLDGAWELLAEPVQTVLRKAGVPDAYERLKDMTRGRSVTREDLASFLRNAPISETDRRRLLALKPSAYTGLAARLVSRELPRTRRGAGRRRGRLQV